MTEIILTPLTVLHVVACIFLILVILIQPGKSGGMGIFGSAGAQQVFGGRGAGNFLTKTTWATATVFFVTSITLAYLSSSVGDSLEQRGAQVEAQKKSDAPDDE
jgi:preprotein translocase subunit SecG